MKERPILFSTPMVQAILEGRKTQTRRIIKPQPFKKDNIWEYTKKSHATVSPDKILDCPIPPIKCPYGAPGDVLWVRETFRLFKNDFYVYKANYKFPEAFRWKPSIYMPKAAARLWLKITDLRVERLQDITEQDAKSEGVEKYNDLFFKDYTNPENKFLCAKTSFTSLWESINGQESWEENPWVWVVEFERIEK